MIEFGGIEDAFQAHSAEKANADHIITRDLKGFKNLSVPAVLLDEYLEKLGES